MQVSNNKVEIQGQDVQGKERSERQFKPVLSLALEFWSRPCSTSCVSGTQDAGRQVGQARSTRQRGVGAIRLGRKRQCKQCDKCKVMCGDVQQMGKSRWRARGRKIAYWLGEGKWALAGVYGDSMRCLSLGGGGWLLDEGEGDWSERRPNGETIEVGARRGDDDKLPRARMGKRNQTQTHAHAQDAAREEEKRKRTGWGGRDRETGRGR